MRPSVEALLATELRHDPEALVREAVRANIRVSANHLRHGSELLEQLIQDDGLLVVGAEYSLDTGVVDFFDGLPGVGWGGNTMSVQWIACPECTFKLPYAILGKQGSFRTGGEFATLCRHRAGFARPDSTNGLDCPALRAKPNGC